jgi:glyoxylase-like metal-dependent hydrolase (beta-lactamase superfamily II)
MKTTQYGANLTQITRLPLVFPVNCYLVREDDGLTLIDTGMSGGAKGILAVAQSLDAPIKRITLTHAHGDHAGSLDELRAALPEAEVLLTARQARLLLGDYHLDPDEPQTKVKGWWQVRQTKPDRVIAPGERVGSLQIVASPGHTPDHISFFDPRDGALIAGDAFQTRGGIAVSGTMRLLFPFPALATWDKATALRSAQSLQALNPARLAVGHGGVLENPIGAMNKAIIAAQSQGHGTSKVFANR